MTIHKAVSEVGTSPERPPQYGTNGIPPLCPDHRSPMEWMATEGAFLCRVKNTEDKYVCERRGARWAVMPKKFVEEVLNQHGTQPVRYRGVFDIVVDSDGIPYLYIATANVLVDLGMTAKLLTKDGKVTAIGLPVDASAYEAAIESAAILEEMAKVSIATLKSDTEQT